MSAASAPKKSIVECPRCKRITDIYKHISLGYTRISVYHVVACQLCGAELLVVTVINDGILPHDQLKARLFHPDRDRAGMSAETSATADRRGRLP